MRFTIILVTLAVLVSLAQAQPVVEEELVLQDYQDQGLDQDGELVVEPPELADAMAELDRQEQESGDLVPHSRQKRAVCRCTRRGRRVVCICLRQRA